MGRNYCSACHMLAMGVKFRKAPTHTCDKLKRKIVRFPKLEHQHLYTISIQRGKIVETKKAIKVRCTAQTIEGVDIPQGFEIWIACNNLSGVHNGFSMTPSIDIWGWQLDGILKMLVMEGLRNG